MIRKIIKDSVKILLSRPKLVRLAFLFTFWHTIFYTYLIIYYFNEIIKTKYEVGVSLSDALKYLFNKIQEFDIIGVIITFFIIVILWNFLLYPIGEATLVYGIKSEENKTLSYVTKGFKKFFAMFEFGALSFAFGFYTFITCIYRVWKMDILNNIFMQILMSLRWVIVLFATIFRPYTKYYMLKDGCRLFPALQKSVLLAFNNIGLTIKAIIFEIFLRIRFVINALIVVIIPFVLVYTASYFKIMDNPSIEIGIRIVTGMLLILVAYINGMVDLFFENYWLKIFEYAETKMEE